MEYLRALIFTALAALTATVASAQSEYIVRPGDTLVIEVLEDAGLNRSAIVLSDGRFSFPFAGSLRANGRTVAEIENSITTAIASNFTNEPNVFVAVVPRVPDPVVPVEPTPPPTMEIYFLGEVNSPGPAVVAPGTRFLQAMAYSGGMTNFAADKRVQLRRTNLQNGQTHMFEIDFRAILNGAQLQNNIVLQEGDVIVVPERRLFE